MKSTPAGRELISRCSVARAAELSERGRKQSYGLMVNDLYDLGDIEKNHEAYAENRAVIAAGAIKKLARPLRDLVQAAR